MIPALKSFAVLPLLFLAAACNSSTEPRHASRGEVSASASPDARGEDLYLQHCSVCHGDRGEGDGPASLYLFPPARRFDLGRFRLVSSENGAPSDADLVATLARGIPGSAMPAWSWLSEPDLAALARHVRALAIEGSSRDLLARAREDGDRLDPEEALRVARDRMTPDRRIEAPAVVPADAESLERGRYLYRVRCALCHAADGTGMRFTRPNEDGTPNWARDLTAGFLKGGDSAHALACRIRAGLPGSAMPPSRLAPADEAALVAYVQSLIPEGVADRLVHMRARLEARRVPRLPAGTDDPAWDAAMAIPVVLAPLTWNDEAVLAASLAALHDGREIALRLSWLDATGEVRLFSDARGGDAAALQISDAPEPALFGMGSPHEPTNLWHWRAFRAEDLAGALDLFESSVHAGEPGRADGARVDAPVYRPILGRLEPSDRADRITVRGVGPLAGAASATDEVEADAQWEGGRWTVVFRRPLRTEARGVVPLAPGSTVQVAVAVWNGAVGDAGARKSISIWQELVIGR